MDPTKRKRLEARGWKVGRVDEFLQLTPEEAAVVELRLALSQNVRKMRLRRRVTQVELARQLRSSQSRVAKIEAGDSSVSLDLLVKPLVVLGASRRDLARIVSSSSRSAAA